MYFILNIFIFNSYIFFNYILKLKNKMEIIKIENSILNKKIFKKLNLEEKLVNLRKQIKEENFIFFSQNGNPIDIEKENDYSIKDILNKDKIIKIGNNPKKVKVLFSEEEIKECDYFSEQKLNDFRKKNNIPKEYIFKYEDAVVELDDEKTYAINDIIKNGEIFLEINDEEKKKKEEEKKKKRKKKKK